MSDYVLCRHRHLVFNLSIYPTEFVYLKTLANQKYEKYINLCIRARFGDNGQRRRSETSISFPLTSSDCIILKTLPNSDISPTPITTPCTRNHDNRKPAVKNSSYNLRIPCVFGGKNYPNKGSGKTPCQR